MNRIRPGGAATLALGVLLAGLTGCEIGGKMANQTGYRGTAMANLYDASSLDARAARIAAGIPAALPASPAPSPGAPVWQNVQVLTDVGAAELARTMISMSTWVTGEPGNCTYCHNLAAMGSDTAADGTPLYTKLVARRMLQMVRDINKNYEGHVANTGVTCYTCHLGKPLPNGLWFYSGPNQLERYFLDREAVRVQTHVIPASNDNRSSLKQTEWTYALMIKMSSSLGVSCNHCHNSRAFYDWTEAPPQRAKAYLGAQMVRHLNNDYLGPLQPIYPASRLGPMGDAPKAQCLTCHNGSYKPLYAYPMAKDYPALWGRKAWNGVPFPAIPPDTTTAEGRAAYQAQLQAEAAAAAAAAAPVNAGASQPATAGQPGFGAMGGQGPAGQDTTGRQR